MAEGTRPLRGTFDRIRGGHAEKLLPAFLLISDLVFDTPDPAVTGAGSALVFAWLWFVRPMRRRLRLEDEPDPKDGSLGLTPGGPRL